MVGGRVKDAKLLGFRVLRYLFVKSIWRELRARIFPNVTLSVCFHMTSANFGHWLSKLSC